MKIIDKYLTEIQTEYGYANPVQTRPRPKPGITGENPEKPLPPGILGPTGMQVDLDNDEIEKDETVSNFANTDYSLWDSKPKMKSK